MDIRPGDLRFIRGEGFRARAIERITGSPWTHVQIMMDSRWCIEAVTPAVRSARIDPTEKAVVLPWRVPNEGWRHATHGERMAAHIRAAALIGQRYSLASLLSDGLLWAGCPVSFDIPGEYNCAELAIAVLGLPLDMRRTDPGRVYAYMMRGIVS